MSAPQPVPSPPASAAGAASAVSSVATAFSSDSEQREARVMAVHEVAPVAEELVTVQSIDAAAERIRGQVVRTPCTPSYALSKLCDSQVFCKMENLQVTGSFKERGASNILNQLGPEERVKGVVAASAGNHALGLSRHGSRLGIPVTVVMPTNAPLVKVKNCRSYGANVIQYGENFKEALGHALQLSLERDLTFVSPYDNQFIINGQGTIGKEILEDVPDVDAIIVPCGGGGLIAGIARYVKDKRPQCRIIGVESRSCPTISAALAAGEPVEITPSPTLADGLSVMKAGVLPFALIKKFVDEIVLVSEADIALAIVRLLEKEKVVCEGAGAASLAAAMSGKLDLKNKKTVLCLCGGNIDMTTVSRVIERGLARDGRLVRIAAQVDDKPGQLARLISLIAAAGGSVKHTIHDRNFASPDPAMVGITVIVETRDFEHIEEICATLRAANIDFASSSEYSVKNMM